MGTSRVRVNYKMAAVPTAKARAFLLYLGKFKPDSGGFEGDFKNYVPKAVPIAAKHKTGYASIQPLADVYGEQKAHDVVALYSFPNKASFDGWFDDYKVSGLADATRVVGRSSDFLLLYGRGRCRLRCVDALRRGEQKIRERRSQGRLPNQLWIENQRYRRSNQWLHNQSWPVHPGTTRRISSRRRGRHSAHHFNRFSERGEETSFPRHPERKRHERRPRAHVGRTVV